MRLRGIWLLALALLPPSAVAKDTPLALYISGQYAQAEAAGIAENDARGFAVAARAAMAEEQMRDEPCLECLKHAEELARRAIAADPKLPEGHIYLAAALGYESRIIGDLAAQAKDYANVARREIDTALADDPKNAWALAALGSWNIEVVHSAGAALGRWLFGARFNVGQEYYAKAFAEAPSNLVLHYQYALSLAAFDLEEYEKEIENQLVLATEGTPQSHYETFARGRAQQLLEVLKRGDTEEARRLVRHDQGYPS